MPLTRHGTLKFMVLAPTLKVAAKEPSWLSVEAAHVKEKWIRAPSAVLYADFFPRHGKKEVKGRKCRNLQGVSAPGEADST